METDAELIRLDYCHYCLIRDRGLFKYSLQNSPSLKALFQVEELLFCYVCTKFAQNAEEFIQKVGNAQKIIEGFAVVNATTLNTIKRQIKPLRHLTIQHSNPMQISGDTEPCIESSDEHIYITYSCGGKVHVPIVKVEVKSESVLQNSDDGGDHDFGDIDELPGHFDTKEDLSLLVMKQELVAEEVELPLLRSRVKREGGRRGKSKKVKVKKEPRAVRNEPTSYVEVIRLSHEEFLLERAAAAAEARYLDAPLQCADCLKGFTMRSSYVQHMAKHSASHGQYECDVCKIRKRTNKLLEYHMKYHQIRYRCKLCHLTLAHRRSIHDHYSACHEAEAAAHQCPHCSKLYKRAHSLRKHVGYAHRGAGAGRPVCDHCQKTFANKVPLRRHMMLIHATEPLPLKTHVCEECGKAFLAPSLLKKHLMKHTDKKEYYCVECDKSFKTDQSLKSHLTNSTPHVNYKELRFPCPQCDKRFPVRRDVERHMNSIHLNHKPYQCEQCDRAYVSKWSLKDHIRMAHEGYKRPLAFPCQMCDKVFDRRQILSSHIRTHTGERPYQCSRCPASFAQSSVLHTHQRLVHLQLTRDGRQKQAR